MNNEIFSRQRLSDVPRSNLLVSMVLSIWYLSSIFRLSKDVGKKISEQHIKHCLSKKCLRTHFRLWFWRCSSTFTVENFEMESIRIFLFSSTMRTAMKKKTFRISWWVRQNSWITIELIFLENSGHSKLRSDVRRRPKSNWD